MLPLLVSKRLLSTLYRLGPTFKSSLVDFHGTTISLESLCHIDAAVYNYLMDHQRKLSARLSRTIHGTLSPRSTELSVRHKFSHHLKQSLSRADGRLWQSEGNLMKCNKIFISMHDFVGKYHESYQTAKKHVSSQRKNPRALNCNPLEYPSLRLI